MYEDRKIEGKVFGILLRHFCVRMYEDREIGGKCLGFYSDTFAYVCTRIVRSKGSVRDFTPTLCVRLYEDRKIEGKCLGFYSDTFAYVCTRICREARS